MRLLSQVHTMHLASGFCLSVFMSVILYITIFWLIEVISLCNGYINQVARVYKIIF